MTLNQICTGMCENSLNTLSVIAFPWEYLPVQPFLHLRSLSCGPGRCGATYKAQKIYLPAWAELSLMVSGYVWWWYFFLFLIPVMCFRTFLGRQQAKVPMIIPRLSHFAFHRGRRTSLRHGGRAGIRTWATLTQVAAAVRWARLMRVWLTASRTGVGGRRALIAVGQQRSRRRWKDIWRLSLHGFVPEASCLQLVFRPLD